MNLFICNTCGHVAFDSKPEMCPVCNSRAFQQNDEVFKESEEKSKEASVKHIPAIKVEKECGFVPENECVDILVRIGTTLHPMEETHFIRFIDCYISRKYAGRVFLTPDLNPAACFHLKSKISTVSIVENCSIHGYWMSEKNLNS